MRKVQQSILHSAITFLVCIHVAVVPTAAQEFQVEKRGLVSDGWHPWYEIKADPENPKNLIVCGTKWDAHLNALLGFVYASSDMGATWLPALEDRNSSWVSEQSCAFGSNHRAYFISEASNVVDGKTDHAKGTTRVYVSTDAGQHWSETTRTGWADFSTSAVSFPSGRLYTFFNARQDLGLLVLAPDGKEVIGPFFNSAIKDRHYHAVYPRDAISLSSGSVVALYHGVASNGEGGDLGFVRADQQSPHPSLLNTVISHTVLDSDCSGYDSGSLAYDVEHNRLFVLYGDGCKKRELRLTWSDDEGRTWAKSVTITHHREREIVAPSLVVGLSGFLGLLWEEGLPPSGRWLFSVIREGKFLEPPMELSPGVKRLEVSNDSLSWIARRERQQGDINTPSKLYEHLITLTIRSDLNEIWKTNGAIMAGNKLLLIWPTGREDGARLSAALLGSVSHAGLSEESAESKAAGPSDVTEKTVILYGGKQFLDKEKATLETCVVLGNRGDRTMTVPIILEAKDVGSSIGTVSILNAANGLSGSGAMWDISKSTRGNVIPAGANSDPICLTFHLQLPSDATLPADLVELLILKLRVVANLQ